MAGKTEAIKQHDVIKSFNVLTPQPLDARTTISSLALIDTEIPLSQRYAGLIFYDDDTRRSYEITPDNNGDLIVFEMLTRVKTFVIPDVIDLSISPKYTFVHNLNTANMFTRCMSENVEIGHHVENIIVVLDVDLLSIHLDFSKYIAATTLTSIPANLKIIVQY